MELSLSEEQEMLKSAVRRFVDQEYPKDTLLELAASGQPAPSGPWEKLIGTGWLGILIPTEYFEQTLGLIRCQIIRRDQTLTVFLDEAP